MEDDGEPFASHERPNRARLSYVESHVFSCRGTTNKLPRKSHEAYENRVPPCLSSIKETEVSFQTREGEVLNIIIFKGI